MKEAPIAVRFAGSGLMFLATACGSAAPAEPTPTSTLEPAPTPASVEAIRTPTPDPYRAAAFSRECNLGEMDTLQMILNRFVQPQAAGRYNSDLFNNLARSSDLKIKEFMDSRTDTVVNNRALYYWELVPHPKANPLTYLLIRFSYPACIPNEPGSDLSFFNEISFTYRGTHPLPDEWLEESLFEGGFKRIRQDRLQHAARAIYVLPDDVRWTAVNEPERHGGDFIGLRGLSISPTGTLMDVRIQPNGFSIRLTVSTASWQLFPRG